VERGICPIASPRRLNCPYNIPEGCIVLNEHNTVVRGVVLGVSGWVLSCVVGGCSGDDEYDASAGKVGDALRVNVSSAKLRGGFRDSWYNLPLTGCTGSLGTAGCCFWCLRSYCFAIYSTHERICRQLASTEMRNYGRPVIGLPPLARKVLSSWIR